MIAITLPNGSVRQYENPLTVLDIATDISEGLARNVLSAKFNGETVEASTRIEDDGDLRLFTWNDDEGKTAFWHSGLSKISFLSTARSSMQCFCAHALDTGSRSISHM